MMLITNVCSTFYPQLEREAEAYSSISQDYPHSQVRDLEIYVDLCIHQYHK